ncbi:MAG TPA: hypothetical protein VGU69_15850 [Rhizomicrobium sp.]|nr:hypothetical protein [Rhizomicrobium sp.]
MAARAGAYVVKAAIGDVGVRRFMFDCMKTMYGGKLIAKGDRVFVFASENEGGHGLIARGVVTEAAAIARRPGVARQTPRVSIAVRVTAHAERTLGRAEIKPHRGKDSAAAELDFKLYRQATNKIVGISDAAAAFLQRCF